MESEFITLSKSEVERFNNVMQYKKQCKKEKVIKVTFALVFVGGILLVVSLIIAAIVSCEIPSSNSRQRHIITASPEQLEAERQRKDEMKVIWQIKRSLEAEQMREERLWNDVDKEMRQRYK